MKMVGVKFDKGKPRMSLVLRDMPLAIAEVAKVATLGAEKYSDGGWQHVPNGKERYTDALYRHLNAEHTGQELDTETGLHHLAHAAWNALVLLEITERGNREKDS